MMDVKNIKTIEDAQRYVEGCVNDYEAGISTKAELLGYLGEYTGRLMELFWDNAKKRIKEKPITDQELFEWLRSQKFQTDQGQQEYKMYFDVDMPKIIRSAIKDLI